MSTKKKYEFTGETMTFQGHTLKRIRYLREVGRINKGEDGGWIESESNLSHEGECRVTMDAKVFGNGKVIEDALVSVESIVRDNAVVGGDSFISGSSIIGADTIITDNVWIRGTCKIFFYLTSFNWSNNHSTMPNPHISGDCSIDGTTEIEGTGFIKESVITNASLYGFLMLENDSIGC